MKNLSTTLAILALFGSAPIICVAQGHVSSPAASLNVIENSKEITLAENDKRHLRLAIDRILEKDQQFRSYLSFESVDDSEIAQFKKLDAKGQLSAMAANKGNLSDEVRKLLSQLQAKNDKENWNDFVEMIQRFGYPSPERIGVKHDQIYVLLLHPPVVRSEIPAHISRCQELLMPEVLSGRMEPRKYATFIDNMHGKILGKPQLYGTNKVFDPETKSVLPPLIANLAQANELRREIGMPELEPGEYRVLASEN